MPLNLGDTGSFPVVDALPVSGVIGQHAVLKADGRAYQWNPFTGAWEQLGTGAGGGAGLETTPIGTILSYAGAIVPSGYLACDGSLVSRTAYASLFQAIGTAYGAGDGSTTFALPDLRGRVSMGAGAGLGEGSSGAAGTTPAGTVLSTRARGEWGGSENHLLTGAQSGTSVHGHTSPAHSHAIVGDYQDFANGYYVPSVRQPYNGAVATTTAGGTTAVAVTINNSAAANASAAHPNVQPFVVTNYMIKAAPQPSGQQLALAQNVVPTCQLFKSGHSIASPVWTAISFNDPTSEVVDTDGMHESVTNPTRITIRTPGMYLLTGWATDGTTTAGQRTQSRWVAIRVNGADIIYHNDYWPAQDGAHGISASIVAKLNAGDYVELAVYAGLAFTSAWNGRLSAVWMGSAQGIVGEQPTSFCRVKRSASLSLSTGAWTAVPFDQEVTDTDNMHDTVTNSSRVTIRTPGVYQIVGRAIPVVNATGIRGLALYVNGAAIAENEEQPTSAAGHGMDVTHTVALNAGDYVELFAYQSSGGALNLSVPELSVAMTGTSAKAVVPTAQAYRATVQSIPASSTFTKVTFENTEANNDSMWASGAPTRLTVNTPGTYMVRGNLWFNTAIIGSYASAMIQKNNNQYVARQDLQSTAAGSARAIQISAILDLAAGDYLELVALNGSNAAVNLDSQGQAGGYSARFELVKVASTGPTPENAPTATPIETTHLIGATGEPAMQNGAVHLDSGTAVPGAGRNVSFRKDAQGKVRFQGVMKSGANGTTVFTLPPGYRPTLSDVSQMVYASGGAAAISVFSDGRVVLSNLVGLVTTWAYLDGVEFDTMTVTSLYTGPKGDPAPAPIFVKARRTVNATLTPSGYQKITFDQETVDNSNAWDGSGKFQPNKAGWYRISAGAVAGTAAVGQGFWVYIVKNSTGNWPTTGECIAQEGEYTSVASSIENSITGSTYLNGTTDFIEIYVWTHAAGWTLSSAPGQTWFEAEEIGPSVKDPATLDPWHSIGAPGEPAFTNAWVNYGAPFNTAGFWKDPNGVVHLRGLIMNGTAGVPIFTLPVGYRPAGQELLSVVANVGGARVDVRTDGTIIVNSYFSGGTNAFMSLDGITFKAA